MRKHWSAIIVSEVVGRVRGEERVRKSAIVGACAFLKEQYGIWQGQLVLLWAVAYINYTSGVPAVLSSCLPPPLLKEGFQPEINPTHTFKEEWL